MLSELWVWVLEKTVNPNLKLECKRHSFIQGSWALCEEVRYEGQALLGLSDPKQSGWYRILFTSD